MKKCSKGGWDAEKKKVTGCEYVEWITGVTEPLEENCPQCNEKWVHYTSVNSKKMKKWSTSGWDREAKKPPGCAYIEWLKAEPPAADTGEEFLPPPSKEQFQFDLPFLKELIQYSL